MLVMTEIKTITDTVYWLMTAKSIRCYRTNARTKLRKLFRFNYRTTNTLLVGLSIRDWATAFVKGARFRFDPSFAEGDKVILDDQQAMIIKIGLNTTVFGVYGDDGYTWRFVPNERIAMLKLEKIVDPELHADTKQEKAQKIIDAIQSSDISSNKLEIDKLKGYTSVKDEKK